MSRIPVVLDFLPVGPVVGYAEINDAGELVATINATELVERIDRLTEIGQLQMLSLGVAFKV